MKNKILIHKNNGTLIIIVFPKFKKAFVITNKYKTYGNIYASYSLYPNSWINLDD